MFSRISSLALLLAMLVACGQREVQAQAERGAETIECAIGPGSEYGPDCLVERVREGDSRILVVRHPDGGFRRLELLPDGGGVTAFDGADRVEQSFQGNMLAVAVGGDRYRFPARDRSADGGS